MNSFACGKNNDVNGDQSFVGGLNNTVNTNSAAVFGRDNTTSGFYGMSMVTGNNNSATEKSNFVTGQYNTASQPYQSVFGQYADATRNKSIFVIGVGSDNTNRDNAFEVVDTVNPIIIMEGLKNSSSYADDSAAATGGVPVGGLYRNGNDVKIRLT